MCMDIVVNMNVSTGRQAEKGVGTTIGGPARAGVKETEVKQSELKRVSRRTQRPIEVYIEPQTRTKRAASGF